MRREAGGEGQAGGQLRECGPTRPSPFLKGQGGASGANTPYTHHPCITTEAECVRVFSNRGDRGLTYIKMKVGVVRASWLGEGRGKTPSAGPATLGFAINKGVKVGVG